MPNPTSGFTANEIIERVIKYIGNTSPEFKSYIQNAIPLAEYRFCKLHDWSFLRKVGLTLVVTEGTFKYTTNVANIGFDMAAENVETVYNEAKGIVLKRVDLKQIRRFDPESNDGTSESSPSHWAVTGDQEIQIWPPTFQTGELKIDGKITPAALVNLDDYPTIPFKYQESFIEYLNALALDRENDDRATAKKGEAFALIKQDVQDDLRQLANVANPRMKSMFEARFDGDSADLDARVWASFWCDWDCY